MVDPKINARNTRTGLKDSTKAAVNSRASARSETRMWLGANPPAKGFPSDEYETTRTLYRPYRLPRMYPDAVCVCPVL